MDAGDIVDREIAHFARVVFPGLATGSMPATEFGTIVLPSFSSPYIVLFHETNEGTLVQVREIESGVRLRDLTHDDRPGITTKSKALEADIVTASLSAIRRALANARPRRPGDMEMMDGVSFYFFNRDSAGRAHSPGSATEAGKLAQLVSALVRFVDGEAEERELRMAAEEARGGLEEFDI